MTATSANREEGGQVALENRLPPTFPQRVALEIAIRNALAGLCGRWSIAIEEESALTLVVSVVAPDGAAWAMSCCNPGRRRPESIAETVRAACSRRRWLGPGRTGSGSHA
jgi:hypothetical protein